MEEFLVVTYPVVFALVVVFSLISWMRVHEVSRERVFQSYVCCFVILFFSMASAWFKVRMSDNPDPNASFEWRAISKIMDFARHLFVYFFIDDYMLMESEHFEKSIQLVVFHGIALIATLEPLLFVIGIFGQVVCALFIVFATVKHSRIYAGRVPFIAFFYLIFTCCNVIMQVAEFYDIVAHKSIILLLGFMPVLMTVWVHFNVQKRRPKVYP